jgi:eukaryotic-like serine/threonine-protein kinase
MTVAAEHRFGRYRVTKPLGAGAMGEVYEAIDDVLGREVAIKTLRTANGVAARFIDDRFRNEARAIAQLSHPGVVQVFDIDLSADPPYLVMERVAGPSLSEQLKAGPLPTEEVVALGIQIARALAAAHTAGVVHRDVKPSNILGAGRGVWKLADFGVAHVPDSSLTMTGQFVGSPAYAAPESLFKGVSSAAGDIYGLGATLFEAATGSWPRLEAKGALLAPVPPIASVLAQLPAHVAAAIDRAVSLEASARPTATELADLLAGVAHATPITHATPIPHARAPSHATPPGGMPSTSTIGVPDGTLPPHARHGPLATAATVAYPMKTTPRALRWQPWAVGGAIVLAVVVVLALRGDDQRATAPGAPGTPVAPIAPPAARTDLPPVGQIMVRPPKNLGGKSSRDWEKVVDKVYDQNFGRALEELDKWERKYGAREETEYLRAQLERLPHELLYDD